MKPFVGSPFQYRVEHVRFVGPDVAINFLHAPLRSRLTLAADDPRREAHVGSSLHDDQARPTMILAKALGRRQIVAFQNTRVSAN